MIQYRNNFDLIRLFAALQVAFLHACEHLGAPDWLVTALGYLPGVPIFFFISGYLIYTSYQSRTSTLNFAWRRALRIFPALWVCFVFTVSVIILTGYLPAGAWLSPEMLIWAGAQLSIAQFFNPEILRGFGVGVINGSLWTISVELQFYMLTPVLALLSRRRWMLPVLIVFFGVVNVAADHVGNATTIAKLFQVSFLPWLYMFVFGAWLASEQEVLRRITALPLWWVVAFFILVELLSWSLSLPAWGNSINPAIYLALAILTLKLAYTKNDLSIRILHGNDLSYGIYIYHMVVINIFIYFGLQSTALVPLAILATIALATISWFFVERPALSLKRLLANNTDVMVSKVA